MVSVVVPAFNAGKYLEECLESLMAQTFKDFEVIIVDDGSTDNTAEIAEKYTRKDERFRLLSVPNGGVSAARNKGIEEARGDYMVFVDADDLLHPLALQEMRESMEESGADVCITDFTEGARPKFTQKKYRKQLFDRDEAVSDILYQNKLHNSPCAVMMKRELLGSDIRFQEGIRYEDLDIFYRLYEGARKFIYLRFPFYFYRSNPRSFINTWSEARLDVLDVTDRIVTYMQEKHPELVAAALSRRFSAHFNMLLLMMKYKVDNPDAMRRCREVIRTGRARALRDPKVRLKNKLGALLSFGGMPLLRFISRIYS